MYTRVKMVRAKNKMYPYLEKVKTIQVNGKPRQKVIKYLGRADLATLDLKKVKGFDKGDHLDHIIPLALGGSNGPKNVRYITKKRNLTKGKKRK